MRRAAVALAASALLALSGCTLSIYNSYRDIESLEVVQALGLDAAGDGGVLLSVATGADASGREPVRLTQEAESLDGAMRGMEQLTGRGRLFFSGTGAIVLGAPAAAESARWLDAIARSKELRLDTELYVLRSGEAAGLLTSDDAPEDVFASLNALGVTGLTVTQVMGCGIQRGASEKYRGVQVDANLIPKVKVEVVISKISVDAVIDAAKKALYTGHIGDGKIFVYNVTRVVKVRTGEENYDALQDVE